MCTYVLWNYYQKDPSTFAWRGGNSKLRQHTTTGDHNSESPMSASRRTSRRTYRCSRSCFTAGATAARWARRASDGGDDSGNARGLTTMTVDARITPMPNLRTTQETSLPPPSLGISRDRRRFCPSCHRHHQRQRQDACASVTIKMPSRQRQQHYHDDGEDACALTAMIVS